MYYHLDLKRVIRWRFFPPRCVWGTSFPPAGLRAVLRKWSRIRGAPRARLRGQYSGRNRGRFIVSLILIPSIGSQAGRACSVLIAGGHGRIGRVLLPIGAARQRKTLWDSSALGVAVPARLSIDPVPGELIAYGAGPHGLNAGEMRRYCRPRRESISSGAITECRTIPFT